MKKRTLAYLTAAAAVCVALVGGTLAYFQDTDAKSNVFTTGNVAIDLIENFGDNNPATPEKLLPSTGSAQNNTLQNGIVKQVSVKNTGSEDAYVRVHIAIPAILDNGNPDFDANQNKLHFNYPNGSTGAGKWDWSKAADDGVYTGNWNYYETKIAVNGKLVDYNVYVVTYGTALKHGEETPYAMHQVYLDSKTSNEAVDSYIAALGENWQILVLAEGVQAAGFASAYEALNTAFGAPNSYEIDWSAAVPQ